VKELGSVYQGAWPYIEYHLQIVSMPRRGRRTHPAGAWQPTQGQASDHDEAPRNAAAASASADGGKPVLQRKGSGKGKGSKGGIKLTRSRSWLLKVGGITLLPCEEALAEILEEYQACQKAGNEDGWKTAHMQLLKAHPFVDIKTQEVQGDALASGVKCTVENFRMNVRSFQNWLRTAAGKPFAEKGKGFDDACYLTSALLRTLMPRGFTVFNFTAAGGETDQAILRGFLKFTGLSATDEDEESGATQEVDAFMFHGHTRADAQRFVVTTKSNGENGKYMFRNIFGNWYCFAGSKNTGKVWQLGLDVSKLFPIPKDTGDFADIPLKIVKQANDIITGMADELSLALREEVNARNLTIMVESNDPDHEHIYPIDRLHLEHVAILDTRGYPIPQQEAYAFFARFGLESVTCTIHSDMGELESSMEAIRSATDNEGAVIYLEQQDGTPVGLVKVKSDHYVKARRTREVVRRLVNQVSNGQPVQEALRGIRHKLQVGMRELTHVTGCSEQHEAWAEFAIAFAEDWARKYSDADEIGQKVLVKEYNSSYGSLYRRFWLARQQSDAPKPA